MLHIATVHEERKPNNSDVQIVSYKVKDLNDQNKTTIHERKDTVNEVHEEKMQPMKCSYCNEEFLGMARLNKHIGDFHNKFSNFDTNNEDVSSDVQDKNDIEVSSGKTKEPVHERKKPYQCKICNETFKARTNLRKHITSAHLKYVLENIPRKSKPFKFVSLLN